MGCVFGLPDFFEILKVPVQCRELLLWFGVLGKYTLVCTLTFWAMERGFETIAKDIEDLTPEISSTGDIFAEWFLRGALPQEQQVCPQTIRSILAPLNAVQAKLKKAPRRPSSSAFCWASCLPGPVPFISLTTPNIGALITRAPKGPPRHRNCQMPPWFLR